MLDSSFLKFFDKFSIESFDGYEWKKFSEAMFRKKGAGDWKLSVEHAEKVPSLPIIGHALRNDLQTGPRKGVIIKNNTCAQSKRLFYEYMPARLALSFLFSICVLNLVNSFS